MLQNFGRDINPWASNDLWKTEKNGNKSPLQLPALQFPPPSTKPHRAGAITNTRLNQMDPGATPTIPSHLNNKCSKYFPSWQAFTQLTAIFYHFSSSQFFTSTFSFSIQAKFFWQLGSWAPGTGTVHSYRFHTKLKEMGSDSKSLLERLIFLSTTCPRRIC